ncbi:transcription factor AP-4 isoform X2 [Neocloeon triangulifer]|uniref:transcription factor AP-4 isoform X2 n=1 Tax=Neocloeon triangulifer TaxID=2078957 RepID=UPI00286F0502|nr:transcription factor AP-4 isoform X2 [Neocloeon triangulifer]
MSVSRKRSDKANLENSEVKIVGRSIRYSMEALDELVEHDSISTAYAGCNSALGENSNSGTEQTPPMEQEKRIRREIANSNERRRMQSINAGFQSLRTLLPHHEGEKLSKAAILQQTAEYIYQLEQEKTRLLSQNCQLKRVINSSEGDAGATKKRRLEAGKEAPVAGASEPVETGEPTKYKIVISSSGVVCVNESSADEGIGSMSPEPNLLDTGEQSVDALRKEMIELRMQLDRERRLRLQLEEQVRSLETQLYPERIREITQQNMIETSETDGSHSIHIDKLDAIPQTVEEEFLQVSPPPSPSATTIVAIDESEQDRIPSVLEAAIKAEPKVEVEVAPRISSPNSSDEMQTRLYAPSTSRQNLETIVEAIRHLEGDHLFSDEPAPQQEVPLALTTSSGRMLKVEVSPMDLGFRQGTTTVLRTGASQIILPAAAVNAAQQQQRPGVIVVKQHT